jgi:Mg-chelatase subunit ChlD
VFVSDINSGNRVPAQTFFELTGDFEWYRAEDVGANLVIADRVLSHPESAPRLDATLENMSPNEFKNIDIIAVIFGTDGNAVAASKTFIELLPQQTKEHLVFTWPRPLPKRIESCTAPADAVLLIDVSGSMNNDNDNPPQPLTDAKEAAAAFINRLNVEDRSGAVSFATDAAHISPLSIAHPATREAVLALSIQPEEESGATNIGAGIILADEELNSARHNPAARKVAVLLTDGQANEPEDPGGEIFALSAAALAKEHGVVFYTIGLGDETNETFLREIAGGEDRVFRAASSDDLDGIYLEISAAICERGAAVIEILPRTKDSFRIGGEVR